MITVGKIDGTSDLTVTDTWLVPDPEREIQVGKQRSTARFNRIHILVRVAIALDEPNEINDASRRSRDDFIIRVRYPLAIMADGPGRVLSAS